ncbi:integrin alpha-PS3 isoform X2 [Drosophila tropicalis]|uniref:integrin alpha-PS3 isoform X2 n=1 Tax=Drosophila tropicalis TaxID=46794 RepID=UPI0035AC0B82
MMARQGHLFLVLSLVVIGVVNLTLAYNLSPLPNVQINDPQFATVIPKVRASYFGYTINLRPHGIFVGAPRAQSTLEAQRGVNETGAIYKCSLLNGTCSPYVFDALGNRQAAANEYTWDSERKDHQWLGASMDGGTSDSDKLLVCAPRFIAPSNSDYHMHGICYWVYNTLSEQPDKVVRISPLRLRDQQVEEDDTGYRYFYYILGEQGLSAHVSDDNKEMLIGAPGIFMWKGSVIRYKQVPLVDQPQASRRDTSEAQKRVKVKRASGDTDINYSPDVSYTTDIPNPHRWGQPDDSYFGYSVATGHFDSTDLKRLLYVATAPQANEQSGEAYIFDVRGKSIEKYHVLRGEQFGEYFGYAVLAEDLNGDGLTDVIVSAPQYALEDSHDNGAIYVFLNKGRFNFEVKQLRSPIATRARFGTTLSRLGDINHDGFNDIAVGAPFAGNGSVFIYLGSQQGLRDQHSQRLDSPVDQTSKYEGSHMFGHGLSRGSDVDGNGFNDFAIGSPNSESVFVYRAYPVVKIQASVRSQSREIKPDQGRIQITACYGLTTTATQASAQQQELAMRIVIDSQLKRVKFTQSSSNELSFTADAKVTQQCRVFDCDVRYSEKDIFKPIEMEMHYELTKNVPNDTAEFCQTCVAVDPADPKVYSEKIIFVTGCASEICIADLQLTAKDVSSTFTLGSANTLRLNYEITNNGETAYLPQFNITSSSRLNYAQIPWNCRVDEAHVMLCDLHGGRPLAKGEKDTISISFDVSSLDGRNLIIDAEVFSTGNEKNSTDNQLHTVIGLVEYTEIDATGGQTNAQIDLEHYKNVAEIVNNYEIKSNGPSTIEALELEFYIPVAYKVAGSIAVIPIIDVNNISMQATFDAQLINIELFDQNNTLLITNPIETSTISQVNKAKSGNRQYDAVKSGHVDILDSSSVATASMTRKRRDLKALTANREQYARISQIKAHELLSDDYKGKLPVNRTIVFNCRDPTMTSCVRAVIRVYNFKPEKPVNLNMRYTVDLNEINAILVDPWEFFVVLIDLKVRKEGDPLGSSLVIKRKIEPNVISKHLDRSLPIWIIIVSVLGGLLLLAGMVYGMYKLGFFERAKKDEMERLTQGNPVEPEAENLNSGSN